MYSDELLLPWFRSLAEHLPGMRLFDAHTHVGGNDPEGWTCSPPQLADALAPVEARAVVFPLAEVAGYRPANDAVLAAAAASEDRLVPFCRVDPHTGPVVELERCLAAGARGVKLHPRAERFDARHPGVSAVFELAEERRLPVTIHSGLGIPSLGRDALLLSERYPHAPLVLAHVGVTDLAWLWRKLDDHPSIFFDTAWWNPADHLALLALVPPGRILLGCALQVGLTADQITSIAGGQLERLVAGEDPLDLGEAPGPAPARPPLLDRVFTLLVGALSRMLEATPADSLVQLAQLGCQVDADNQQAPLFTAITDLLDRQQLYAATASLDGRRTAGFHLVLAAAALAAAPNAPLPSNPSTLPSR